MSEVRYNSEAFGEDYPRRKQRRATPRQAGAFHNNRFYTEAGEVIGGVSVQGMPESSRRAPSDDVIYIDPPDASYSEDFARDAAQDAQLSGPRVRRSNIPGLNDRADDEVPVIEAGAPANDGLFELGLDPIDADMFSIYGTEAEASGFADADFTPFPAPTPALISADADADAEAGAYASFETGSFDAADSVADAYDSGQFERVQQGFASADPMAAGAVFDTSFAYDEPRRTSPVLRGALVFLAILLVLGGVGWFWWSHREIEVTINGQPMSARPGQALSELYDPAAQGFKAGNLVSVSGRVLTEGGGEPYKITVNGEELTSEASAEYKVASHDVIVYADGNDVSEEYEAETITVEPKLTMNGEAGAIAYISQWGYTGTSEIRKGKTSGEQATVEVTPVKDVVVTLLNPAPSDDQKLIALTFDDGPSVYTTQVLDVLDEYDAKATFFDVGTYIESYPSIDQDIVARGHQLASHSYSHQQFTLVYADTVFSEVQGGFKAISDATGLTTTVLRPPYGELRQTTWVETQGLMSVSVLWNIDTEDWAVPGSAVIAQRIIDNAYNGAIVLMHTGGGDRSQTVAALRTVLPELKAEGYTFVTINELMAADSRIPAEVAAGNMTMPSDSVWPTEIGDYRGTSEADEATETAEEATADADAAVDAEAAA